MILRMGESAIAVSAPMVTGSAIVLSRPIPSPAVP
jgi:hypothetical protein